jgi:DNA-binding GntR family transcriptional regulator
MVGSATTMAAVGSCTIPAAATVAVSVAVRLTRLSSTAGDPNRAGGGALRDVARIDTNRLLSTEVHHRLPSIAPSSVREEVTAVLRDAIWRGRLKPGDRLNELALSAELEVSRPPLREAIRMLEGEGLVISQPRHGSFVKRLSGDDVLEIYSVRCTLEQMAADLVIDAERPQLVDQLDVLEREMREDRELHEMIAVDLRFHWLLVHAGGNRRLLAMWERLAGELRLALSLVTPELFNTEFVGHTHRPLVAALRSGDREGVERAVGRLLDVGHSLRERWSALDGKDG